jgi:hypothetical protein
VAVSFIGGGTRSTTENHRPAENRLPLKIKIVLGESYHAATTIQPIENREQVRRSNFN